MLGWFDNRALPEPPPASAAEWWCRNYDRAMTKTSRRRYAHRHQWGQAAWLRAVLVVLGLALIGSGLVGVLT
jgi:hypothetical protein